jgi:GABA permease
MVVANRTADSPELIAALRKRCTRSFVRFTLLVPAVPYGLAWAADMKAGAPAAAAQAEAGARRMRRSGLDLERAIVGDPDPLSAVGDALHTGGYDEVIVSTLPRGVAHWFRLSLPDRLRRLTDIPVSHVSAHPYLDRG